MTDLKPVLVKEPVGDLRDGIERGERWRDRNGIANDIEVEAWIRWWVGSAEWTDLDIDCAEDDRREDTGSHVPDDGHEEGQDRRHGQIESD